LKRSARSSAPVFGRGDGHVDLAMDSTYEITTKLFLYRHDQVLHDAVFAFRDVFPHVEGKNLLAVGFRRVFHLRYLFRKKAASVSEGRTRFALTGYSPPVPPVRGARDLLAEQGFQIASAVEHADDLHATLVGQGAIEDQVFGEVRHFPGAKVLGLRAAERARASEARG